MAHVEAEDDPLWIFGYGSLVWRPAFDFVEQRHGYIRDRERRFWQGSTDHRGVPESPGRVVTLVDAPGAVCWGSVYRVARADREGVLGGLDHRERGGFVRESVEVQLSARSGGAHARISALVYVATPENPNFLGPAPLHEIASQVRGAHGPSGSNVEYVLRLADALAEMGAEDRHVFDLAGLLPGRR
jgi:cation transport regulator ChaC